MAFALAALLCFASGFLLISLFRPPASLLLQISLAVGYGLGIFSITFFLTRIAGSAQIMQVDAAVFAVLLIAQFLTRRQATPQMGLLSQDIRNTPQWLRRAITATFALTCLSASYVAIMRTLAHPHGDGWDAFAIWNLHARFLALNGSEWRDAFTSVISWSHPDYPLLTPAATAHFWRYLGRDAAFVPALIGLTFTFITAGLLYSVLSILRGRMLAMLGAISLLATPAFIEQGTAQYADVPLSFFMLATLALLCLHARASSDGGWKSGRLVVLAGMAAGLAAWTKNEGLLFLASTISARMLVFWFPENEGSISHRPRTLSAFWRSSVPLWLGMIPLLAVILYFKHSVAGPSELFADHSTILHKLLTPSRYWAVIKWYVKSPFRFGHWMAIPGTVLLAGFYIAAARKPATKKDSAFRTSSVALVLTLTGYFVIYLITPYEIYWHLRFSLDRLFLQLWPSTIFLLFLAMPELVSAKSAR